MANDIHFRFTRKANPWRTLKDVYDGDSSINMSIAIKKGMAFKDSDLLHIPAIEYSDFQTDTRLSTNREGKYLVVAGKDSDSLRLIDFSSITTEKISQLIDSSTPDNSKLYYYETSKGFCYTSIGKEFIFGNYYSKEVPSDETIYAFSGDHNDYALSAARAYVTNSISFNAFSFHAATENHISPIGLYNTDESLIYLSDGSYDLSTIEGAHEFIRKGLLVQSESGSASDTSYVSGDGYVKVNNVPRNNRPLVVYGHVDFTSGGQNVCALGLFTGTREVNVFNGEHNAIQLFDTHIHFGDDVERNDAYKAVNELCSKNSHSSILIGNSLRIKSIQKYRGSLIDDTIYTTDKDFMAGYNDVTGKCICMTLDREEPVVNVSMPVYVSSMGMRVVGLTPDTLGGHNIGKGVVTDDRPFLAYPVEEGAKGIPSIEYDVQAFYNGPYFYNTEEEAIAAGEALVNGEHMNYHIFQQDGDPSKGSWVLYKEDKTITKTSDYCCFEYVASTARAAGGSSWTYSTVEETARKIPSEALHGVDNGRFIGYVKFSETMRMDMYHKDNFGGRFCWHWHWYQATDDDDRASQSSVYLPEGTACAKESKMYSYTVENNVYTYTRKDEYVEKGVLYGLVINPELTDPKSLTSAPDVYLCKITNDDGSIKSEHLPYLQTSQCNRSCERIGDIYTFSINYLGRVCSWSISSDKLDSYFDVTTLDDGTEYISFKKQLENDLKEDTSVSGENAFVTPTALEGNVCIDIDKVVKTGNIFDQTHSICIPLYSGCTFVER